MYYHLAKKSFFSILTDGEITDKDCNYNYIYTYMMKEYDGN